MKFRKIVSAAESKSWYTEFAGRANFLPWRGVAAGAVFIRSVSSASPPGTAGAINIYVAAAASSDSWMNLDLLDFNQLDFGELLEAQLSE